MSENDSYELLETSEVGAKDKSSYRILMYDKKQVEELEKTAIEEILDSKIDIKHYSDAFHIKSFYYFPEKFPDSANKKKRGKKSSIYFIEEVGKYLWTLWHNSKNPDDRNRFLTYCYPLIDGVVFKYARHKHGIHYEEIFQSAILKIIQGLDKFDPNRVVGTDDKGNPIYARIFTYITLVLNYGITTITMSYGAEKINTVSYEELSRVFGDNHNSSDASIVYQEFLVLLDSILLNTEEYDFSEQQILVLLSLRELLNDHASLASVANNLLITLKNKTGLKVTQIAETLALLKEYFGPLIITGNHSKYNQIDDYNEYH